MRSIRERDFLVATFIFLASLAVTVYAYASIREIEGPSDGVITGIRAGTYSYQIVAGSHCPGSFTVTVTHDATWALRSSGHLRAAYGKIITDVSLETEAYFNPLGQLNSARAIVSTSNYKIMVSVSNPHPISINIHSEGAGPEFHKSLSIPGPVMIATNKDRSYRIEYANLPSSQSPALGALHALISKELNLSFVESNLSPPICQSQTEDRLDLLPLVIRARSIVQPLMAVTGDAMTREINR